MGGGVSAPHSERTQPPVEFVGKSTLGLFEADQRVRYPPFSVKKEVGRASQLLGLRPAAWHPLHCAHKTVKDAVRRLRR